MLMNSLLQLMIYMGYDYINYIFGKFFFYLIAFMSY